MNADFSIYAPMKSAQAEAQALRYEMFLGKSGRRWLVAVQPNRADNIYVEGKSGSDGFGGATLTFPLQDGEQIALTGPWKASARSLFADTGLDIRDKFLTIGIVARERESRGYLQACTYRGVLHRDTDWVLGLFDRVDRIAQWWADALGRPVYYGMLSQGGGCHGKIEPGVK